MSHEYPKNIPELEIGTYYTDGFALYEVVEVFENYGLAANEIGRRTFVSLRDCATGVIGEVDDLMILALTKVMDAQQEYIETLD